jgi:hypothetical protein
MTVEAHNIIERAKHDRLACSFGVLVEWRRLPPALPALPAPPATSWVVAIARFGMLR